MHLDVADIGLTVSVGHGRAELGVQAFSVGNGATQFGVEFADFLVGAALLALAQGHQHESQRQHESHEDADRHQVGIDSRGQRLTRHHAGDEDQPEGAEGNDGADQAEPGRSCDFSGPLLLGNHDHSLSGATQSRSTVPAGKRMPDTEVSSAHNTTFRGL